MGICRRMYCTGPLLRRNPECKPKLIRLWDARTLEEISAIEQSVNQDGALGPGSSGECRLMSREQRKTRRWRLRRVGRDWRRIWKFKCLHECFQIHELNIQCI